MQGRALWPLIPASDVGSPPWGTDAPTVPAPYPIEYHFAQTSHGGACLRPNGMAFPFYPPTIRLPRHQLASEASGSWGCGAYYGSHWFQLCWDRRSERLPIMAKELLPIVLACTVWGQEWARLCICCLCDNQAVVACLRSRTSREGHCMHMLRTLAFVEARHSFALRPQYISTTDNHLADDLSRDKLTSFLAKVPNAGTRATPLPTLLLDLLLDHSLDWTSPRWLQMFSDIFRRTSLPLSDGCTIQQ